MKHIYLILHLIFFGTLCGKPSLFSQPLTPQQHGLIPHVLNDSVLGDVHYYITKPTSKEPKPVLLVLDGSGHMPIFSLIKKSDGSSQLYGSIPVRVSRLADEYHVVMISKPGIPFLDSLRVESYGEFLNKYAAPDIYHDRLSLSWRAISASRIIDELLSVLPVKDSTVIVMGYSEGGRVASKVAVINPAVSHIISIVGGGLSQCYNFITKQRLKAQKGEMSHDEAQKVIDSLHVVFKDIYAHPNATDKFWYGHTYQRWASFCKDIPLENMLDLDIPILVIAAGLDENSPISGLDYIPLEFMRNGKTNLTYTVYPNCDHWFNDQVEKSNRKNEVVDYALRWVDSH